MSPTPSLLISIKMDVHAAAPSLLILIKMNVMQQRPLWAAVLTFNPYLLISINELVISIIHLLISIN